MKLFSLLLKLSFLFVFFLLLSDSQLFIAKLWYQDSSYHKDYEKEIYLPKKMLPMLEEYDATAKKYEVKTNTIPLLIVFEPALQDYGLAGVCFFTGFWSDRRVIMISSLYKNDHFMLKSVLFHELAHCRSDVTVHHGKFGNMFSEYIHNIQSQEGFNWHAKRMFRYLKKVQEVPVKKGHSRGLEGS